MGVEIVRVKSVGFFELVREHLEGLEDGHDKGQYVQFLREGMLTSPESFFLLAGIEEGGEIVGFTILTVPPGQKFTWLMHAWADPKKCPKETIQDVWKRNLAWTKALGRIEIRTETKRGSAFERLYGFEEHAVILKLSVLEKETEAENGRRIESETNEHLNDGTTETSEPRGGSTDSSGTN